MARDIPIGNGTVLAAFDPDYRIRDFYYPRVGKENHALGFPWRLGIWVDGFFSWINKKHWRIHRDYIEDALVTNVTLQHPRIGLRIVFNDMVDYEKNILVRRIRLLNTAGRPLHVRLFFHTDLNVLENENGDTVFFDPKNSCLVHFKGPRYFLMSCATKTSLGVSHYSTGRKRQSGYKGTWADAENGNLSANPIAQGSVDSVIGVHMDVAAGQEAACHYWMAVGNSYPEVDALNHFVQEAGPEWIVERNVQFWRRWLSATEQEELEQLPEHLRRLYKRSLLILRTQTDNGGAILAANDTDIWQFNRDTYSYMWPRDGAIIAQTLDRAGYGGIAHNFLDFCTRKAVNYNYSASILAETGFLMHKYNPDGSVGSSWHPWLQDHEIQFPIQEDETALVIWAVWQHYLLNRNLDEVRQFYNPFVRKAADFLLSFRSSQTGLPYPSYDLWEEVRCVSSFTLATVIAGLLAAAHLAELFYEKDRGELYAQGAAELKQALDDYLYCPSKGRFARGMAYENNKEYCDTTVDASLMGLVLFDVQDPLDPRMIKTVKFIENKLWVPGPVGGLARYEGDTYHKAPGMESLPGNPWIITTLWLAQYKAATASTNNALNEVLMLLDWAAARALPSGVLPEQVDPHSGEIISVSPLSWSHATFVAAVLDYMEAASEIRHARPPRHDAREGRKAVN